MSGSRAAGKVNYRLQLCREWLKLNRPDIYRAICEEVEKKFPNAKNSPAALPEALANLK